MNKNTQDTSLSHRVKLTKAGGKREDRIAYNKNVIWEFQKIWRKTTSVGRSWNVRNSDVCKNWSDKAIMVSHKSFYMLVGVILNWNFPLHEPSNTVHCLAYAGFGGGFLSPHKWKTRYRKQWLKLESYSTPTVNLILFQCPFLHIQYTLTIYINNIYKIYINL